MIDEILNLVSEEEIFQTYFPEEIILNKAYVNPWRKDTNPGCYFNYYNNRLYFYDWASNFGPIDCFDACKLANNNCNIAKAYSIINNDLDLNLFNNPASHDARSGVITMPKIKRPSREPLKKINRLTYQPAEFTKDQLAWWKQYNISKILLDDYNVATCKWANYNGNIKYSSVSPIYIYSDADGPYKRYMPFSIKQKWRTARAIIEGYEQLRSDKVLFIHSSQKDTMCVKSLGWQGINPSSENSYNKILSISEELNARFDHIYVWMNNDRAGKEASFKLTNQTGWNYINCPDNMPKDPSDVCKEYGINTVNEIIKEKLNRDGIK